MEANHTLRNAFSSDLDVPKSKVFPSAPTMVGPKPKIFLLQSPYPYCIALGKFGSPEYGVKKSYKRHKISSVILSRVTMSRAVILYLQFFTSTYI